MSALQPHPLNRSFEWQPARGPRRIVSERQVRSWDERGFFVLENAFDPQTIAEVVSETDRYE